MASVLLWLLLAGVAGVFALPKVDLLSVAGDELFAAGVLAFELVFATGLAELLTVFAIGEAELTLELAGAWLVLGCACFAVVFDWRLVLEDATFAVERVAI